MSDKKEATKSTKEEKQIKSALLLFDDNKNKLNLLSELSDLKDNISKEGIRDDSETNIALHPQC